MQAACHVVSDCRTHTCSCRKTDSDKKCRYRTLRDTISRATLPHMDTPQPTPDTTQNASECPTGNASTARPLSPRQQRKLANKAAWRKRWEEHQAKRAQHQDPLVRAGARAGEVAKPKRVKLRAPHRTIKGKWRKVGGPTALAICREHVACIPPALTCLTHHCTRKCYDQTIRDYAAEVQRLHRLADHLALTAPLALGIAPLLGKRPAMPAPPTYTEPRPIHTRSSEAMDAARHASAVVLALGGVAGLDVFEGGGLGGSGQDAGGEGTPSQFLQCPPEPSPPSQFFSQSVEVAPPACDPSPASAPPAVAACCPCMAARPLVWLEPAGWAEMFD